MTSTTTHYICPKCEADSVEKSRVKFGEKVIVSLLCGHVVPETALIPLRDKGYSLLHSLGYRDYQIEGVKFAEESRTTIGGKEGIRCLIADEQGLGKTWQASGVIALHDDMFPAIVVTKTTLTIQWWHELRRLVGHDKTYQVIRSGKEMAIPGFDVYVLTYDLLKKHEFIFALLGEYPKTLILDECQSIKNHASGRAGAVYEVADKAFNIIGLSGTPIKNHAGEYFSILNILRPDIFSSYDRYVDEHCDFYDTAYGRKIGGLKNPDLFQDLTRKFIIRRTRAEAAPELPTMERVFHHVELSKKLQSAYKDAVKELEELLYAEQDEDTMSNMLAIYAKMRKITGLSKGALECVDYVTDFLLSTDRKIVIFLHHHTVATLLEANLNKWLSDGGYRPILNLHSGLSGEQRAETVRKFREEPYRVMIASTLAAGEGLNLQFCSDAIMLERQWNPANEEQAEGRFIRLGRASDAGPVRMIYMIASETIDEYFTELVESKRAIMASTLDGKDISWDQTSLMKELAQAIVSKGKTKWTMTKG